MNALHHLTSHALCRWTTAALLLLVVASPLSGQEYRTLPVDDSQRNNQPAVTRLLRGEGWNAAGQQQLDQYFKQFAFPRWTHPSNADQLSNYRNEVLQQLRTARDPARAYLLQEAFTYFKNMAAAPTVFPAARYNAMLLLGGLNESDQVSSTDPTRPLPAALPELIRVYRDASQPDYLRIAALIGLARHAYLGVADRTILEDQIVPALLATAEAKEPEGERSLEVHNWFREWAIRGLGSARWPGKGDQVVKTLVTLISDPEEANEIRYAAARALGGIDYTQAQSVQASQLAAAISDLTLAVITGEIATIEEQNMLRRVGTGGGFTGGGYDSGSYGGESSSPYPSSYGSGTGGRTEPREINDSRRRVLTGLGAVLNAINGDGGQYTGLTGLATDPAVRTETAELKKKIAAIVDFFETNPVIAQQRRLIDQLETARKEFAPAPTAP